MVLSLNNYANSNLNLIIKIIGCIIWFRECGADKTLIVMYNQGYHQSRTKIKNRGGGI